MKERERESDDDNDDDDEQFQQSKLSTFFGLSIIGLNYLWIRVFVTKAASLYNYILLCSDFKF